MDQFIVLPDKVLTNAGIVSAEFQSKGIRSFHEACRYVNELPYGYNSDRDDLMILFKDEYMIYRRALSEVILKRPELEGVDVKRVLHAREEGLKLLRANLQ